MSYDNAKQQRAEVADTSAPSEMADVCSALENALDQLPVEQRAKDFIFRGVVHALK